MPVAFVIKSTVTSKFNFLIKSNTFSLTLPAMPVLTFSSIGTSTGTGPSGESLSHLPYIHLSIQLSPIINIFFMSN